MKEFSASDFVAWTKFEHPDTDFVVIKVPRCAKCLMFVNSSLKDYSEDNVAVYEHKNDRYAADILQQCDALSVPIVLCRFKDIDGRNKLHVLNVAALGDCNTVAYMDELNAGNLEFFGYNNYDESISEDSDYCAMRIIRTRFGEVDSQDMADHKLFVNYVNSMPK
jgi:hypothetical protein